MAEGARQLARGQRPSLPALMLSPGNAVRLTDELARMRGAVMKLGQLMSMETGDLLPPEMAAAMSRLRAEAHPMPPRQLKATLAANWGRDWLRDFERFDVTPIAAASIGQVHRARTRDGRDLAIKIQYPGVRRSIDSDVDNVAALIRWSGVLPRGADPTPLLEEAKRQLHEEADYRREGACLARFGALLADAPGLQVPALHADLTTGDVLAMDHVAGGPVEGLITAPQAVRDSVATRLVGLALREMFEFGLMQTDPNFANYRHDAATDTVVLLDFGATREIPAAMAEGYRALLRAGMAGDARAVERAATDLGLIGPALPAAHLQELLTLAELAFAPLRQPGAVDVAGLGITERLRDAGMALAMEHGPGGHLPPAEVLFVQRKLGGLYLLAHRLRARVPGHALMTPWLAAGTSAAS
ncbi:ubiquinol-cytochrome C reductase [Rhodobaculum claviforme]|uniref:Ubiquinol-cytochrome C reductase n=2 Tax=Rhodobaculum claviforme TaxID=1549854 RepID=A0A934TJ02_9RHOB|nr:ubiquinol-cytochrome C reductase [Rhodobaculum claviforme]